MRTKFLHIFNDSFSSYFLYKNSDAAPTTLQKFYQNKSVFLTGGTGFLGKVIMEKLLRSCEIDTIYVLIRSKKGKDIATRMEDVVNDVVI